MAFGAVSPTLFFIAVAVLEAMKAIQHVEAERKLTDLSSDGQCLFTKLRTLFCTITSLDNTTWR
jgi:hypothetical protein